MKDDLQIFLDEMADVKPLNTSALQPDLHQYQLDGNVEARRAAAQASEYLSKLTIDVGLVTPVEPDEVFGFRRQGVQEAVFNNLKNGKYRFKTELDIHGFKIKQARQAVVDYILETHRTGQRCVYIVHGKGYKSKPFAGLLKSFVCNWLVEMEEVLAVHSAQKQHGGTGALYITLRKSEQQKIETKEQNHKGVGFR